jgi:putative inorganic carbon (hco3(-)) transporter
LFMFFDSKRFVSRFFYGAALIVFVFAIVATQSRGGTLALLCVGAYYWSKSENKVAMLAVAVVLAVLALSYAPPAYFARMNDMTNTEEGSAQARVEAWKRATEMAVQSPIVGIGAGHFGVIYGARYQRPNQNAHSIYFLVLAELGFPGFIVLLWFIGSNLVRNRQATKDVSRANTSAARTQLGLLAAMSAAVIAYATGGAFLNAIYYPHMYVLAALAVATRRIVRQTVTDNVPVPQKPSITYHWALQPVLGGSARTSVMKNADPGYQAIHNARGRRFPQ